MGFLIVPGKVAVEPGESRVVKANSACAGPNRPRDRIKATEPQNTRFLAEVLPEWGGTACRSPPPAGGVSGSQGTSGECDCLRRVNQEQKTNIFTLNKTIGSY